MTVVDLWGGRLRQFHLDTLRQADCPTCGRGEFSWLFGAAGSRAAVLCGRNAVQITPAACGPMALDQLAAKLVGLGPLVANDFLLRLKIDAYELTIFPDGRAIIGGTGDVATARALYAKYVGN